MPTDQRFPIRRLKSGNYQARPSGAAPATFSTYKEARAWCLEQLLQRERGITAPTGTTTITFEQYARDFLASRTGSRPSTVSLIERNLRVHAFPAFGHVRMSQLRPSHFVSWLRGLVDSGKKPTTIRTIVQHVRQVVHAAQRDRIMFDDPTAGLGLPPVGERIRPLPTEDQVRALIDSIDPRYRALVSLSFAVGLRQGEAFALRRQSVDFFRSRVTVNAQVVQIRSGRPEWSPTTKNHRDRSILLPEPVLHDLVAHFAEFVDGDDPDQLIFTDADGSILNKNIWNRAAWKRAVRAAGLPKETRSHDMRHYAATQMLRHGVSLPQVAKILGDRKETVLKVYGHAVPDDEQRAADVMAALIGIRGGTKVAREDLAQAR